MPIRLSFPTVAAVVLGTSINIPELVLTTSFEDFLSCHDRAVVKQALTGCSSNVSFCDDTVTNLVSIFSQFCCRQRPIPQNLCGLIVQMAQHEFVTKPLGALHGLHSGVPFKHLDFWNGFSIERLFALYNELRVSPKQVIEKWIEPFPITTDQQRVCSYLTTFIENLSRSDLRAFVRFVTGSSSMMAKDIVVTFNALLEWPDDLSATHVVVNFSSRHAIKPTANLPRSFTVFSEAQMHGKCMHACCVT